MIDRYIYICVCVLDSFGIRNRSFGVGNLYDSLCFGILASETYDFGPAQADRHMKNCHPLGSTNGNLEIISENSFIYLEVPKRTSWWLIPDAMRTMVLAYVPTKLGDFVANVGTYSIHGASGNIIVWPSLLIWLRIRWQGVNDGKQNLKQQLTIWALFFLTRMPRYPHLWQSRRGRWWSPMKSWDTSWLNQSHMLNSFTLLCSTPISTFSTDFLQERWNFCWKFSAWSTFELAHEFLLRFTGAVLRSFPQFSRANRWPAGGGHEWLGSRDPWRTCFFKRQLYEEVAPGNLT